MNKFLSLSALSVFFIALAMPLPLFADGNRGEGGGGDSHDRQKKVEEGSGSSAMDQHKKSTMEYKNHPEGKASDYKKEGSDGMDKAHQTGKDAMEHGSDSSSNSDMKSKMREGS